MGGRWIKKTYAFAISLLVFGLAIIALFPDFMPFNHKIPSDFPLEGHKGFGRIQWLDALAFETIFDATIKRFGKPQLHNLYIGGGYPIAGDLRDGTFSPLTWAAVFLDPLPRMKLKILLGFLTGFLSVIFLVRRKFSMGLTGALSAGLIFLAGLRFWPSLIDFPLDSHMLLALPAFVILWTGRGKLKDSILAGLFISLAFFQSGNGIFAVVAAFTLTGFALALGKDKKIEHPLFTVGAALCFAMLFGAIKLAPMAETFVSFRAFWASPVAPTLRISPFSHIYTGAFFYIMKLILAGVLISFWLVSKPKKTGGAICVGIFTFLVLLPQWTVLSKGLFGDSNLFGFIDSPARFFFPFLIFFYALSGALVIKWFKENLSSGKVRVVLFGILFFLLFIAGGYSEKTAWRPVAKPINLDRFAKTGSSSPFFQVRTPHKRIELPLSETTHPALLSPLHIGVTDPPLLFAYRTRAVPKARIKPKKIEAVKVMRYKGEWAASSRKLTYTYIEDWGNKLLIRGKAERSGHFILNRNFNKGWKVDQGELVNIRGLLAVRAPAPGQYEFTLRYRPFSLIFGIVTTFVTIILSLVVFIVERKKEEG